MITITGLRTELRDGATLKFYPILSKWKIAEQRMMIKVCSIIMLFIFSKHCYVNKSQNKFV